MLKGSVFVPLFSTIERLNTPFVMVIFGATGDLTRRKLIPALFDLFQEGFLPEDFTLLGYARRPWTQEDFVSEAGVMLHDSPHIDQIRLKQFFTHLDYKQGNFDELSDYEGLAAKLKELDGSAGQSARRLFYLATPAESYDAILDGIKKANLQEPVGKGDSWTRIVVEKPFGSDLATAEELDKRLTGIFAENQIYRIDHYLAKETAQNIMTFRFANAIFEPIWSAQHIERIEIEMYEEIGIGTRGNFYDRTGALRDVLQNHLLQLLALVAMEQPITGEANSFRDARTKLLESVRCFDVDNLERNVVLGQYQSYCNEENVKPDSLAETFVAIRAEINLPRWQGVPVILVTGKKLEAALTRIRVTFRQPLRSVFELPVNGADRNILTFDIQPNEGIRLNLLAKQPGFGHTIQSVGMHFHYHENFDATGIDAYNRLLLDAIDGDQALFTRSDEIDAEWRFVDPIVKKMAELKLEPKIYRDGSAGPAGVTQLLRAAT